MSRPPILPKRMLCPQKHAGHQLPGAASAGGSMAGTESRDRQNPSWLCDLEQFNYLSLSFLTCKVEVILVPT